MSITNTAVRAGSPLQLPARTRLLLGTDALTALGLGLTQPYLLLLLTSAYGVSLAVASALASVAAVVSLAGNPLGGILTDRIGGLRTMLGGLAAATLGLVLLGSGGTPSAAAIGIGLTGFGWSLVLPAFSAQLADGVPDRTRVFTWQYALFNAGLGSGAAVAGLVVVHPGHLDALPRLWFVAAALVTTALVLLGVKGRTPCSRIQGNKDSFLAAGGGGYREAMRDRRLRRVLAVAAGMSAAGYGVYAVGPSVVALAAGDPGALAWVSVANCATVVLGLPLALRVGGHLTPYASIRWTAVTWAVAWTLCLGQLAGLGPGVRVALPAAAALVGAGELVLAAALSTLVNELAPDHLRGRYNAALTVALTAGVWSGPALASVAAGLDRPWLLFAAALAILATVWRGAR